MSKILKYSLISIVVALFGFGIYFYFRNQSNEIENSTQSDIYTCSMHPEIIQNEPGNCPICGMTLVKKETQNPKINNSDIVALLQSTNVFVAGDYPSITPKDTALSSIVKVPGFIEYDPNSAVNIVARTNGRIEKMYVNYKFQKVFKGQKLFDLYSPELLTEQQNFIYLITNDAENGSMIKASKQKLTLYGMSSSQISALATAKKTNSIITVFSPANGIVQDTDEMEKESNARMSIQESNNQSFGLKEGDYIKKNQVVFKLLNTAKVWGVFNIIQGQSSLVKVNQNIRIKTELDENEIDAKINFVENQFNPSDKTNRIRVYLNNSMYNFPIGLRLEGFISSNAVQGIWLPKTALISIGNKKIVFLKVQNGFKTKGVKTGVEIKNFVQIINGISAKDSVVQNAQYLMDSETFIKAN